MIKSRNQISLSGARRSACLGAILAGEALAWKRFSEPGPYSILLTDRLCKEIQSERQRISSGKAASSALSQPIEENDSALLPAEGGLRQLTDQPVQELAEAKP